MDVSVVAKYTGKDIIGHFTLVCPGLHKRLGRMTYRLVDFLGMFGWCRVSNRPRCSGGVPTSAYGRFRRPLRLAQDHLITQFRGHVWMEQGNQLCPFTHVGYSNKGAIGDECALSLLESETVIFLVERAQFSL